MENADNDSAYKYPPSSAIHTTMLTTLLLFSEIISSRNTIFFVFPVVSQRHGNMKWIIIPNRIINAFTETLNGDYFLILEKLSLKVFYITRIMKRD